MVIKIIERGEIPNPVKEKTCTHCKTKFSFQKSDTIKRGDYDPRDQREAPWFAIACPVCGRETASGFTVGDGIDYTPKTSNHYGWKD